MRCYEGLFSSRDQLLNPTSLRISVALPVVRLGRMGNGLWLCILALLLAALPQCPAFATELCERYCFKELNIDIEMMGSPVVLNRDRIVNVFRGNVQLKHGDTYVPGEQLIVKLEPSSMQCVLEVENAFSSFKEGSCDNKSRVLCDKQGKGQGSLLLAGNGDGILSIKAAWSKYFSQGVQLSPTLELYPPDVNVDVDVTTTTTGRDL